MGYRSNVMALIYPDVGNGLEEQAMYDQLKVLMGTTFKAVSDEFGDPYMVWMDADRVLKFALEDVKWYDIYADVQLFTKMLEAFESGDIPGYCTEFVRVGEADDDVISERSGENNQYYLNVRRSIDCNV